MSNSKVKAGLITLLVLVGAGVGLYVVQWRRATPPPNTLAGTAPRETTQAAGEPGTSSSKGFGGADLRLGTPKRDSSGKLRVAVHFSAKKGASVGAFHAELQIPSDRWILEDAVTPDGADWQVSADQTAPATPPADGSGAYSVITLDVDGSGNAIRSGLVAFLIFTPLADNDADAIPANLAKLQTTMLESGSPRSPQKNDQEKSQSTPEPGELPTGPENPSLGCFFFNH